MQKKYRVLYTISNFDTAGSGKVLYDLAKNLDKEQFEVEIACGRDTGSFFESVKNLGIPIHIFKTKTHYRPYLSLPTRILTISRFYREQQYDLIHSWQWSSDWTEALAAKLAGIKWIYTKKAMGFKSKHWKIKSAMADYIIMINEDMAKYFKSNKNKSLIPLGIDTDYFSPNQNPIPSKRQFQIITVANLVKVKGIELLLDAIYKMEDANVNLIVIGNKDNDYGKYLIQKTTELGLTDSVEFIGSKSDIRPYVLESDLFVIPTLNEGRREGMPMALVEAMSLGIITIGSNISGIKYVLKNFKELLFEPADVDDLILKIKRVKSMSVEQRMQLAKRLREFVLSHFNLSKFIRSHEELYKSILNK